MAPRMRAERKNGLTMTGNPEDVKRMLSVNTSGQTGKRTGPGSPGYIPQKKRNTGDGFYRGNWKAKMNADQLSAGLKEKAMQGQQNLAVQRLSNAGTMEGKRFDAGAKEERRTALYAQQDKNRGALFDQEDQQTETGHLNAMELLSKQNAQDIYKTTGRADLAKNTELGMPQDFSATDVLANYQAPEAPQPFDFQAGKQETKQGEATPDKVLDPNTGLSFTTDEYKGIVADMNQMQNFRTQEELEAWTTNLQQTDPERYRRLQIYNSQQR